MLDTSSYEPVFHRLNYTVISQRANWPDHVNCEVELAHIYRGSIAVETGASEFVAHPGATYLVFTGDAHSERSLAEPLRYVTIKFRVGMSHERSLREAAGTTPLTYENRAAIQLYIGRLKGLVWDDERDDSANETLDLLLKALASAYSHVRIDASNDRSYRHRRLIDTALDFLTRNASRGISIYNVAAHCHVSVDYLSAVFRQQIGLSPMSCLQDFRMSRAKELLQDPEATICEVSERLGFSSPYYFSRLFKRQVGVPPSDYRRRLAVPAGR